MGDSCKGRAQGDKELFATFDDCCSKHLWRLPNSPCKPCTEDFWEAYFSFSPPPEVGYYPIYTEDGYSCSNDSTGAVVPFVTSWKYKTLVECCYDNFHWVQEWLVGCILDGFDGDIGVPCDPAPELSQLWYVNFLEGGGYECVRECVEGSDCNGRASSEKIHYSTYDECFQSTSQVD